MKRISFGRAFQVRNFCGLLGLLSVTAFGLGINECPQTGQVDMDGDGYSVEEGDCDDLDPTVNPGAPEIRDGLDNDCDGIVD